MHLATLNSALLSRNFTRVLSVVWAGALFELAAQVDAPVGDRPPVFHDRLAEALDILTDFFHAEGKGPSIQIYSEAHRLLNKVVTAIHKVRFDGVVKATLLPKLLNRGRC